MPVQLWSSSSHAAEGQAPLSSAEALLCDMNGTLVDPAPIELMRVRMEEGGVPIPPAVVSAGDVERGKPDPAPYLKAAEILGVPISSCLVLEDAASGYIAARRAGAQVLLVGESVPEADPHVPRIADFTTR